MSENLAQSLPEEQNFSRDLKSSVCAIIKKPLVTGIVWNNYIWLNYLI